MTGPVSRLSANKPVKRSKVANALPIIQALWVSWATLSDYRHAGHWPLRITARRGSRHATLGPSRRALGAPLRADGSFAVQGPESIGNLRSCPGSGPRPDFTPSSKGLRKDSRCRGNYFLFAIIDSCWRAGGSADAVSWASASGAGPTANPARAASRMR